jgi:hypothetical protein
LREWVKNSKRALRRCQQAEDGDDGPSVWIQNVAAHVHFPNLRDGMGTEIGQCQWIPQCEFMHFSDRIELNLDK